MSIEESIYLDDSNFLTDIYKHWAFDIKMLGLWQREMSAERVLLVWSKGQDTLGILWFQTLTLSRPLGQDQSHLREQEI